MEFNEIIIKLESLNLNYEIIRFRDKVVSARMTDTSEDHNYDPKNAIKTLVIITKQGLRAVILKGNDSIDKDKLKKLVGKWSVLSSEKLIDLGFVPGTVNPIVLNLPTIIDSKALELEVWSMGAGEVDKGINIKSSETTKHLNYRIEDISASDDNINHMTDLTTEEKIHLIKRNTQECITDEDLKALIESNTPLSHYIGFEISGLVHLGTGYISMGKIADFLKAGARCRIFLADFHSYLNNKLGGNWDNIRWATENYFKQGLIASLKCHEVDESQVEFVYGKELYNNNLKHWETFMEVGKHVTLSRNLRSISIMGKKQGTDVDMSTLFYPPLQVADIFTMQVNLAHAGMDQRKAHVVARQVAKNLKINPLKDSKGEIIAPVAIHQNLIAGLTGPENVDVNQSSEDVAVDLKMSKSKPNSAIFVHDTPDEIRNKIKKAYGPPQVVEMNPLLNWVETLVFWGEKEGEFTINRPEKFGGNVTYTHLDQVVADYKTGKLFPLDLKNGLADWLIEKLEPARKHFEIPEHKTALEKMKELMAEK